MNTVPDPRRSASIPTLPFILIALLGLVAGTAELTRGSHRSGTVRAPVPTWAPSADPVLCHRLIFGWANERLARSASEEKSLAGLPRRRCGLVWDDSQSNRGTLILSRDEAPVSLPATVAGPWRRTTRGWERIDAAPHWQFQRVAQAPRLAALHPLVWALLQLLLSLAALVAAEPDPLPQSPLGRKKSPKFLTRMYESKRQRATNT